jgi:hypothetical protein
MGVSHWFADKKESRVSDEAAHENDSASRLANSQKALAICCSAEQ